MSKLTAKIRRYIDYYTPREVMGPVILVFSTENVVDILFQMYAPFRSRLFGWVIVMIVSIILVGYWGEADEDMEEFEEELKEDGLVD